jgi:hypothetical protein
MGEISSLTINAIILRLYLWVQRRRGWQYAKFSYRLNYLAELAKKIVR